MRALLQTAIIGLVAFLALPAWAEEVLPENRLIANAVHILKRSYLTTNSSLQILSPDAAVLTGDQQAPLLIAQTSRCVFEIKTKGAYGYKIDFNLMTSEYNTTCSGTSCDINVAGNGPVGCLTDTQGRDQCRPYVSLRYSGIEDGREVLATLDYIRQQCPSLEQKPARPRF